MNRKIKLIYLKVNSEKRISKKLRFQLKNKVQESIFNRYKKRNNKLKWN